MAEGLFDNVYNPDVLSCLANLSNDEVFTPPEVVNRMLDMLPQELFSNPDTTFLDPACKTGVFLREIAKRLIVGLEPQIPDLQERIYHIMHKQLYGIAITELTSLLSRRGVYCSKYPNSEFSVSHFETAEGNIRFRRTQHAWQGGRCVFCGASQAEYDRGDELETHAYEIIHSPKPEELFKMKFDVVISNPPYQLSTNSESAQAKPIYQHFVETAKALKPRYISMIIPSRWFSGGMGLDSFRSDMLQDNRLARVVDFQNAAECFPGVEIKGGVCYFLWDSKATGDAVIESHINDRVSVATRPLLEPGLDVFVRYNEAISILRKVKGQQEESFADFINPQRFFGFPTKYRAQSEKSSITPVRIYGNKHVGYVAENQVTMNRQAINQYKVFVTEAYNGGDKWPHQIINKPFVGYPNDVCTDTYMCIGPFASEAIASNVCSYMRTKFFRMMVMLVKNTQHGAKKVYSLVPKLDFSTEWTDEMLYERYGLDAEEIAFIDSMIKTMDTNGGAE